MLTYFYSIILLLFFICFFFLLRNWNFRVLLLEQEAMIVQTIQRANSSLKNGDTMIIYFPTKRNVSFFLVQTNYAFRQAYSLLSSNVWLYMLSCLPFRTKQNRKEENIVTCFQQNNLLSFFLCSLHAGAVGWEVQQHYISSILSHFGLSCCFTSFNIQVSHDGTINNLCTFFGVK